MFGQFINPCMTLISLNAEWWWRSFRWLWEPPESVFSIQVCGTRFWLSRTTCANAWHCIFTTQNIRVINRYFAVVRCRLALPTMGIVTNTEGFRESWNLSCISVHSSMPFSAYMRNVSTRSAKVLLSHCFSWRTWPGTAIMSTAFGREGTLGSAWSPYSYSWRNTSHNASGWSRSGYFSLSLITIGRNASVKHRIVIESTQVWCGHFSYHFPEPLF